MDSDSGGGSIDDENLVLFLINLLNTIKLLLHHINSSTPSPIFPPPPPPWTTSSSSGRRYDVGMVALPLMIQEEMETVISSHRLQPEPEPGPPPPHHHWDTHTPNSSHRTLYDRYISRLMDESTFRKFLHVSPSLFEHLCQELHPFLEKMNTSSLLSIPVSKRIAVALHWFATGSTCSEVSQRFGIGEASAFKCYRELCKVLCTHYKHKLSYPSGNELGRVIHGFQSIYGLPNCAGVVDCIRFEIERPRISDGYDYLDESHMYSVAAQIVVDRDMRILNVSTGYSGGYSDSHVLKLSRMYTEVVSNGLLDGQSLLLHGTEVPLYLIGDLGYPLKTWLLTPYYAQNRSACEEAFNRKHGQVHSIVSMTSHVLKRWGVLAQKMRVSLKMATATIGACCVLHNMMVDWNEGLELEDYALLHSEQPLQEPEQGVVEIDYEIGRRIRDALAMEVYGQT